MIYSRPVPRTGARVWSQITTNARIQFWHVKYGAGATLGRSARRALWSWAEMGVFVNTMAETLLVGVTGTHWLSKNGFRFSRGRFPPIGNKWSYNIAIRSRDIWMARGAAAGKP